MYFDDQDQSTQPQEPEIIETSATEQEPQEDQEQHQENIYDGLTDDLGNLIKDKVYGKLAKYKQYDDIVNDYNYHVSDIPEDVSGYSFSKENPLYAAAMYDDQSAAIVDTLKRSAMESGLTRRQFTSVMDGFGDMILEIMKTLPQNQVKDDPQIKQYKQARDKQLYEAELERLGGHKNAEALSHRAARFIVQQMQKGLFNKVEADNLFKYLDANGAVGVSTFNKMISIVGGFDKNAQDGVPQLASYAEDVETDKEFFEKYKKLKTAEEREFALRKRRSFGKTEKLKV